MRLDSRNKRLAVAGGAVVIIAAAAYLAFGFFGIHTLFVDDVVSEELPDFATTAADSDSDPATDEADAAADPGDSSADDPAADSTGTAGSEDSTDAADTTESEASTTPEAPSGPIVDRSGQFESRNRYTVTGEAVVLTDGGDQRILRLEDFESTNGPDLNVYLRAADGQYVDLGALKGNIGSQNYDIPPDVDLDTYSVVEIWCVRFSTSFGDATLVAS